MNIFYLDRDPVICASYHNDKHVVKMILETAQLLSSVHHILNKNRFNFLYKLTHKNHPCAIWARTNKNNYLWLYRLFIALGDEYHLRYGKTHLSIKKFKDVFKNLPLNIDDGKFFDPPQCMPDYLHSDDTVLSYRYYYMKEKIKIAKWKTQKPDWFL